MTAIRYTVAATRSDEKETSGAIGRDERGREIGYIVETYFVRWEVCSSRSGAYAQDELQEAHDTAAERNRKPLALRVQATRDGKKFGAWQSPRYFASGAVRDAAIIAYVEGAKKRAAKKVK